MFEFIISILSGDMTEAKKKGVTTGVTIGYRSLVLLGIIYLVVDKVEQKQYRENMSEQILQIRMTQNTDSIKDGIESFDHQRYEAHFARLDNTNIMLKSDVSTIKGKIGLN